MYLVISPVLIEKVIYGELWTRRQQRTLSDTRDTHQSVDEVVRSKAFESISISFLLVAQRPSGCSLTLGTRSSTFEGYCT